VDWLRRLLGGPDETELEEAHEEEREAVTHRQDAIENRLKRIEAQARLHDSFRQAEHAVTRRR
jgi:hypothetical protein